MRKILLGLVAAAAIATPLVAATAANAATTAPSGSTVFLSKSTIQSAGPPEQRRVRRPQAQ